VLLPGDERALSSAIVTAIDQPGQRTQWAASARRRVETELSFEARMRRLERVYERLVAVRAGTGLAREHAW
jgi:glycosyltransferase involved in cell wall biosynthesis